MQAAHSNSGIQSLQGKVAIVTGAGAGIGRAVAVELGRHGARVALAGRRQVPLEETAQEVVAAGGEALAIPTDVTVWDQVVALVRQVEDTWGPVDILVNNAGYGSYAPVVDMPEDEWDQMMAVNLKGVFLCSKAVLPSMQARRRGQILTIGSVLSTRVEAGKAGYVATKWGVLGFTDTLALECRPYNIRVSTLCPGSARTTFANQDPLKKGPTLDPYQIARSAVHVLSAPEDVLIDRLHMFPFYP